MARTALIATFLTLSLATTARAEELGDSSPPDGAPVYTTDDRWVRPMLFGVGGLFAAALGVGGLVWIRKRDLVPLATSHEEDPSADRH